MKPQKCWQINIKWEFTEQKVPKKIQVTFFTDGINVKYHLKRNKNKKIFFCYISLLMFFRIFHIWKRFFTVWKWTINFCVNFLCLWCDDFGVKLRVLMENWCSFEENEKYSNLIALVCSEFENKSIKNSKIRWNFNLVPIDEWPYYLFNF